tara:strand:- start:951 stop:1649 length:699 start_codon:yes stop_codon:yes gene_type:complete
MATLKQISNSFAYYQGWYGTCPEYNSNNCEDFNLISGESPNLIKKYPMIHKVELISGNSEATLGYSGVVPDGPLLDFQQVSKLECGRAYRIILSEGFSQFEIPEFTFATSITDENYRVTDQCIPPTPSPSPLVCCGDTKMSTRPNQESVNNLTCIGNVNGTLCWDEMAGLKMPTSYLCSFEDEDFEEYGLKITISANISNSRFRFTKDDGKCYEVALFHENNDGINIFQIIT